MADIEKSMIFMLNEDTPIIETAIHLNRLYFYFDFPTLNEKGSLIYRVQVQVKKYNENNIEIEADFFEFVPGATIYSEDNDIIPKHHIYYDMDRGYYSFQINYMYKPETREEGGNIFYSLSTFITIDNNIPQIYEKFLSAHNTGDLYRALEENNSLYLLYDRDPLNYANVLRKYDIIKPINSSYKKIKNISSTNLEIEFVGDKTLGFLLALFKDELFYKVIDDYFDSVPIEGEIKFIMPFNNKDYYFNIVGNISKLIQDNKGG